jgi:[glutamine synthetase] adenylyltransferase / [glutamine synthetase]-adenylyl-L-tyrosine phosphorylase
MHKLSELLQAEPQDAAAIHARLESLGFAEVIRRVTSTTRAQKLLEGLASTPPERDALLHVLDALVKNLGDTPDPLRALLNLSRLADAVPDRASWYHDLQHHPSPRTRLCRLLSFSQALADTLVCEPQLMKLLRKPAHPLSRAALRAAADASLQAAETPAARLDALRAFRRRETLRIGLLDMESQTWRDKDDFNLVVRQISDLAQVCVQKALQILSNEPITGFAVLGMGKLGARELNYSSDIDLIFIHDGNAAEMEKLGESLFKALTASSARGVLYRVDMRLRPEGKAGPLVTAMAYAADYYESYAAAWEWQALIKSRAMAGDARLARRFRKFTRGVTWAKRPDDSHLREMLAMKRRMETAPDGADPNNVKQGPGAIRDAEWVVQQLQMMVGPQHPRCRASATLRALEALREQAALTYEEERNLREGYLFLRVLEHRLQLLDERAVRTLPTDEGARAALARRMGSTLRGGAAARWLDEEHTRHRRDVRAQCERMFWGWRDGPPSLETQETGGTVQTDASLQPSDFSFQPSEDSRRRLRRMAEGTAANPLPAPLARQIAATLPEAMEHVEHAADPERAIANLERLCDASGNRLSLLRSLAGAPDLARAVFAILGGSEVLSDTLIRFPQLLDLAAQRPLLAAPKTWQQARTDCRDYCLAFRDRKAALRRWKAREMLRIGLRDLALEAPAPEIAAEISDLARACIAFACDEVAAARRPASYNVAFAVLGMGKLGGGEMHYGSDADVIFTYGLPAAPDGLGDGTLVGSAEAAGWAGDLMHLMGDRTEEGVCFAMDPRLRPDGRNGPLALTVRGYIDYFERATGGIAVWERQALTRARYVAGDAATAAQLMAAIRHVAFPAEWRPGWGDELRHIKSRVENERAARGSSTRGGRPTSVYDVKLGSGALSDIEFCAQWLAMKNGARVPDLQMPNTLHQIEAARGAALLSDVEAAALRDAYLFLRRAELRLQITQDHNVRAVQRGSKGWTSWARAVFPDEPDEVATARFEAEWQTHTRAARTVMECVRDEL